MKLLSLAVFIKSLALTVIITLLNGWYPGGTLLGFLLIFTVAGGCFCSLRQRRKSHERTQSHHHRTDRTIGYRVPVPVAWHF